MLYSNLWINSVAYKNVQIWGNAGKNQEPRRGRKKGGEDLEIVATGIVSVLDRGFL